MKESCRKTERGFSLLELLVATAIMLIVLAVVMSKLGDAIKVGTTTSELTVAQQSLRTAHEYIQRDLITAGDGLRGIGGIRVPETFVTSYLTRTPVFTFDASGNRVDPGYVSLPIIVYDNQVFNTTTSTPVSVPGSSPATTVYVGNFEGQTYYTDRITLLLVDQDFQSISLPAQRPGGTNRMTGNGGSVHLDGALTPAQFASRDFDLGDIYFFSSASGAAFGLVTGVDAAAGQLRFDFANVANSGTPPPGGVIDLGINETVANGPLNRVFIAPPTAGNPAPEPAPMTMTRMRLVHYFVNASKQLIRRTFGVRLNGAAAISPSFFDVVVAENVTRLQFRYKLDNRGQPLDFLANDDQQKAVREVEVDVEVETTRAVGNSQRRLSATTSTSVRNLQFRRALGRS